MYGYDYGYHGYGHHGYGPHHYQYPPWFRGPGRYPTPEEQLSMLEDYKKDLEQELKYVEREIKDLKGGIEAGKGEAESRSKGR